MFNDVLRANKFYLALLCFMAVGLLVQLTGKILYTSGSANGAHVYILFIIPSLVVPAWLYCKHRDFFSRDVGIFLLAVVVFLGWGAISAGWGDGDFSFLSLLKRSLVIILYLLGIIFLVSSADLKWIKGFLLLAVSIVAIGALVSLFYQFIILDKSFGWRIFRLSRMGFGNWIDLGNPVMAGVYLGVFAVIAVALIGLEKQRMHYIAVFSLAVLLVYIFLSFSRTAWVGGVAAAVFLLFQFRSRSLVWLAVVFVLTILVVSGVYFDELLREVTHKQLSHREETWQWALDHVGENMIFGHGYGHPFWESKHFVHAHNFYLQVAYEGGLMGLFALLTMLFVVCRSYWKNRGDVLVCLGFSLVVFLMVIMLAEIDHVITRPGVYWTIFWFPLAFTLGAVNRVHFQKQAVT